MLCSHEPPEPAPCLHARRLVAGALPTVARSRRRRCAIALAFQAGLITQRRAQVDGRELHRLGEHATPAACPKREIRRERAVERVVGVVAPPVARLAPGADAARRLRNRIGQASAATGATGKSSNRQVRSRNVCIHSSKREQSVDLQAVVRTARGVVGGQPGHRRRVDDAAPGERPLGERVANERCEILHEPRADRRAEAGLLPPDDVVRQHRLLALLEDVLPLQPVQLQIRRNARGQRDELVVEQRHAHLDGGGHRHLVGVREVEAGRNVLASR